MVASVSPLPAPPAAAEPAAPLGTPHLRGWHNEPCPCLNLPLPLPAASVLPAGLFFLFHLFFFPFFFFSPFFFSFLPLFLSGSQPVVGRQPLLETISRADLCQPPRMSTAGLSCHPLRCASEIQVALSGSGQQCVGEFNLLQVPCCPHLCSRSAGVAKS